MSDKVSLREYIDRRFDDQDKAVQTAMISAKEAVQAALAAAEKAVNKAEMASDKRFEAANEVKATFGVQLTDKLGISEYRTAHQALVDKIDGLTVRIAAMEGRSGGFSKSWAIVVAVVGIAIAVIGLIFTFTR